MATIVDINFTGVTITEPGDGHNTGTLSGTLQVNYTTGIVTLASGTTDLHFSGPPGHSYTTFVLAHVGDVFTLTSGTGLTLTWTGQQPSALTVGTGLNVVILPGHIYSTLSAATNHLISTIPCFAAGTLIRRPRGDAPVESLQVGDLVVTASGEPRPVKWIGHSDFDLRSHPNPRPVFPVRIAADALGPGRPSQDLYVSSGHSICIDLCGEVLIPAGLLVNGTTVAPVEVEEISYWHVELDSHDILIANNLPAESYLAMGNRTFFAEAGATVDAPEGGERTYADFCRPVAIDGPILAFVRERLMIQAQALGWTASRDADLHLLVDGEIRHPLAEGDAAVFLFRDTARDVRLVSNTFVPARIGLGDRRELGVALYGLAFVGSGGEARRVSLDDPRLGEGLHGDEASSGAYWRWTKGELVLDPQFWAGLTGQVAVFVNYNAQTTRQWIPPARPAEVIPVKSRSKQRLYSVR
ncbi:MAG: Hint domain-containing protein [Hyphomicrobiales bacterium]|nr:Hint domain-containing protein [Hyphomicrobiales bacterium]